MQISKSEVGFDAPVSSMTRESDDASILCEKNDDYPRPNARVENVAYSLIGIFKSDIRSRYEEGDIALSRLREEIIARSGEV